jgi:hypothetical protein
LTEFSCSLFPSYVVADYERSNFTVSQCLFSENTTSQIVAINTPNSHLGLRKGALIAIIIAIIVSLIIIASGGYICYSRVTKKKRERARRAQDERDALAAVIAASQQMDEARADGQVYEAFAPKPAELVGAQWRISELQGDKMGHELAGKEVRAELDA